jgi:hypothetical protein
MSPGRPDDLLPPPFADGDGPELLHVLADLALTPSPGADVLVVLDGVGSRLLDENFALTPTLRRHRQGVREIRTTAPATTSTAMVSLLTGLAPAQHGILGHRTIDPERHLAVEQLQGDGVLDPATHMPVATLGDRALRPVAHVGPATHQGSLLTAIGYRGWQVRTHDRQADRVGAVVSALRAVGPDGLVLLHLSDVDKAGHRHGVDSDSWRDALSTVDSVLGALLRRLPRGTRLTVTADHGMVDTSPADTADLARHSELLAEVVVTAGEGRLFQMRLREGADADALAARIQDLVGERGVVLLREQAIAAGLWGPPGDPMPDRVRARLGDLLVLGRGTGTLTDSRWRRPGQHVEIGVHGSLTPQESLVPLLELEC